MKAIFLPETDVKSLDWLYPIFDLIRNGIVLTDEQSNIIYSNLAYSRMTGYSKDELIGQSPGLVRSGYHNEGFYKNIWNSLKNEGTWEGEIWNRSKSGRVYPSMLNITKLINRANNVTYYLGISSDISALKLDAIQDLNLALYDFLTKLPNLLSAQDYFNRLVKQLLLKVAANAALADTNHKITIVKVELQNLKSINELYGYQAGDKVLIEVTKKLQAKIHKSDYLARIEGDCFLIIIVHIHTDTELGNFLNLLNDVFSSAFNVDGVDIDASCSISTNVFQNKAESLDELIKKARLVKT